MGLVNSIPQEAWRLENGDIDSVRMLFRRPNLLANPLAVKRRTVPTKVRLAFAGRCNVHSRCPRNPGNAHLTFLRVVQYRDQFIPIGAPGT